MLLVSSNDYNNIEGSVVNGDHSATYSLYMNYHLQSIKLVKINTN